MAKNNDQHTDFKTFMMGMERHPHAKTLLAELDQRPPLQSTLIAFTLWYSGAAFGRLSSKDFNTLDEACQHWRQSIIRNLAQLNHHIEHLNSQSVQQDSQALVKFANEAGLGMLEHTLMRPQKLKRSTKQKLKDSCTNLAKYLKHSDCHYNQAIQQNLVGLLAILFSDEQRYNIEEKLSQAMQHAKVRHQAFQQLSIADI